MITPSKTSGSDGSCPVPLNGVVEKLTTLDVTPGTMTSTPPTELSARISFRPVPTGTPWFISTTLTCRVASDATSPPIRSLVKISTLTSLAAFLLCCGTRYSGVNLSDLDAALTAYVHPTAMIKSTLPISSRSKM